MGPKPDNGATELVVLSSGDDVDENNELIVDIISKIIFR
jgi:hypothetical protein